MNDICDDWAILSRTSTDILKLFGEPLRGVMSQDYTGFAWQVYEVWQGQNSLLKNQHSLALTRNVVI